MFLIQDKVVSLSIIEEFFCCDLQKCLGQCCVDGDAGAPLLHSELKPIADALPKIKHLLSPEAIRVIKEEGISCTDREGDLVTTLANERDCVFTTYAPGGLCLCALEKAWREGEITDNPKPISCSLYPIRVSKTGPYTALNYHRWKICKPAEVKGRAQGIRIYQALKEPLIRAFGLQWYDELCLTAQEYLRQKEQKHKP